MNVCRYFENEYWFYRPQPNSRFYVYLDEVPENKKAMKNVCYFIVVFTVLLSCMSSQSIFTLQNSKTILPGAVDKQVYFGMPLEEFRALKSVKNLDENDEDFRITVLETIDDPDVSYLGYYFDKDEAQRLYEVLIIYKVEEKPEEEAKALFGVPNYDEKEWRVTRPKSFNVWAWTFKKKLIVVGMIPDTEWSEENW